MPCCTPHTLARSHHRILLVPPPQVIWNRGVLPFQNLLRTSPLLKCMVPSNPYSTHAFLNPCFSQQDGEFVEVFNESVTDPCAWLGKVTSTIEVGQRYQVSLHIVTQTSKPGGRCESLTNPWWHRCCCLAGGWVKQVKIHPPNMAADIMEAGTAPPTDSGSCTPGSCDTAWSTSHAGSRERLRK